MSEIGTAQRVLNTVNAMSSTAADVAKALDIPQPSARRILNDLKGQGMVRKDASDHSWSTTTRGARLATAVEIVDEAPHTPTPEELDDVFRGDDEATDIIADQILRGEGDDDVLADLTATEEYLSEGEDAALDTTPDTDDDQ